MRALGRLGLWALGAYGLAALAALAAMLWVEATGHRPGAGARADVILVLGAIQNPDGTLHPSTQRRVDRAVAFYRAGEAGLVVMSGGPPYGDRTPATGVLMAASARDQGVPEAALRIEGRSHSTLHNTLFARPLIPRGARVWVLTEGYHLPRGLASAAFAGLSVDGYASAGGWDAPAYAAWGAARELLAWPFNIARGAAFLALRALGVPEQTLYPMLV